MDFGKRLRELREGKEMSQDRLAETLRVSKSSISMWERGLRTPELETFEAFNSATKLINKFHTVETTVETNPVGIGK